MPPKIGVYLCHCYGEIGKILDLEKLSRQAGKWRGVAASVHYPALCSADGLEIIAEDVRQGRVDRVVVGACSPAVHRDTFLRLARQVGLNEHFLERCNLREQCTSLAAGWEPYDAGRINNYGYGRLPGVITSMDLEVLARPDGPTGGQLIRPHDKKSVRRVAFIQCAGSRDKRHLAYCSGVCCAATLKQIDYVRAAAPEAGIFVFYMDIRTPGNLEELYRRAREEHGAVFIRGNPYAAAECLAAIQNQSII